MATHIEDSEKLREREQAREKILRIVLRNLQDDLVLGAGRITFDPFDSDDLREAARIALERP
jgi:hypothetical protein